MIVLTAALVISGFTVFFGFRTAIGYHRLMAAMKNLKENEASQLPVKIREGLHSRWSASWQSPVFHEITMADVAWATKVPVGVAVRPIRRDLRLMICGIAAMHVVLFIQLWSSQ